MDVFSVVSQPEVKCRYRPIHSLNWQQQKSLCFKCVVWHCWERSIVNQPLTCLWADGFVGFPGAVWWLRSQSFSRRLQLTID